MSHIVEVVATLTDATENLARNCIDALASTKGTGRVEIGGSNIHFDDAHTNTKDAGRVKFGGSCIRF